MNIRVLMENSAMEERLACEHGLSLYIETGDKKILFDAGQSAAFADNAQKLGVDLAGVDLCILSHGHYDHSGGLTRFLEINDHAPVYVHRRAFEPHYNAEGKYIGVNPALAGHPRIVLTDDLCNLAPDLTLCTCAGMKASYPDSAKGMLTQEGDALVPDTFAHEQYLLAIEDGKRIVISGCSHKGVLNIVSWLKPDVLVGGFHFMKLDPQGEDAVFLERAAGALMGRSCTYFTGHCTGDAAYVFLKARMGSRLHAMPVGREIVI